MKMKVPQNNSGISFWDLAMRDPIIQRRNSSDLHKIEPFNIHTNVALSLSYKAR